MFFKRFDRRYMLLAGLINYLLLSDFWVKVHLGLIKNPRLYRYNNIQIPRLITGKIKKNNLGRR